MRIPLAAAAAALALATPASVGAQAPVLGLRVGYALPFGDVAGPTSVRDVMKSNVPLQLDAGLKLWERWIVGTYLSYGFAQLSGTADRACGTADCSASVIRLGVQGALHSELRPDREVWAGVLAGWERLHFDAPGPLELTASGWELGLQGGFDFASPSTGFGPFASLGFGRFSSVSGVADRPERTHVTLQLGIRGYFKL